MKVLSNLGWSRQVHTRQKFLWKEVKVDDETDVARIRSRVVAFGSTEAIAALDRVGALDKAAFAWVFGEEEPLRTDPVVWTSKTDQAIQNLRAGLSQFESTAQPRTDVLTRFEHAGIRSYCKHTPFRNRCPARRSSST